MVEQNNFTTTVETWLQQAGDFGIILPDGWFGRPNDNRHQITWYAKRQNRIIIEVDKQLYLLFTNPAKAHISDQQLIISEFKQLIFNYQTYGDLTAHLQVFDSGELILQSYRKGEYTPVDTTSPQTEILPWLKENTQFKLQMQGSKIVNKETEISWTEERDNKIILELEKDLYILVTKPLESQINEKSLTITNHKQIVLDLQNHNLVKCEATKKSDLEFVVV